jgi:hypothetical protein
VLQRVLLGDNCNNTRSVSGTFFCALFTRSAGSAFEKYMPREWRQDDRFDTMK